ncbi:hypothetical protein CISG_07121 [Coccidioides immitis RMSCC 3703]|uniref:Uncharacterized protein n=1 Tax=Coccidioides immitis RMSCC 3703 TaxID=454286 RepID=A0A0J8QZS9_COCIT|nr:hypothetical protein CISG_07121 [Coccidioides immitis RMSCC 3703]
MMGTRLLRTDPTPKEAFGLLCRILEKKIPVLCLQNSRNMGCMFVDRLSGLMGKCSEDPRLAEPRSVKPTAPMRVLESATNQLRRNERLQFWWAGSVILSRDVRKTRSCASYGCQKPNFELYREQTLESIHPLN